MKDMNFVDNQNLITVNLPCQGSVGPKGVRKSKKSIT